jgi:hypothetical protein
MIGLGAAAAGLVLKGKLLAVVVLTGVILYIEGSIC